MTLSAANLQRAWDLYEEGLRDTCQLRAPVEGASANSITGKSWPTVSATVACAVLDGSGSATGSEMFDNASLPNGRTVQLPRGTTVAENWHITPTTGNWAGATFEVLDVQKAGSYGPAVTCQCVEVQA